MEAQQNSCKRMLLGEILLDRGLVTKEQLEQALRVQVGGMRRLGSILVKMKILTAESLTDALSAQQNLPIINVRAEVRPEVKRVLPRYLCRKYGVLPLSLESNNVLRLAMVDPLDHVAVADVENFTGFVVQPVLARHSDIERAISAHVAFSSQDLFNPQVYKSVARAAAAAVLVLLAVNGFMVYREVQDQKKQAAVLERGTITHRNDGSVRYNHQDLTIDHDASDSVFFSGRGGHADSYYGIRFQHPGQLASFMEGNKDQFSEKQVKWVRWVLDTQINPADGSVVAKRN